MPGFAGVSQTVHGLHTRLEAVEHAENWYSLVPHPVQAEQGDEMEGAERLRMTRATTRRKDFEVGGDLVRSVCRDVSTGCGSEPHGHCIMQAQGTTEIYSILVHTASALVLHCTLMYSLVGHVVVHAAERIAVAHGIRNAHTGIRYARLSD